MAVILDEMSSETTRSPNGMRRHVLTPEEIARAHSPEALEKRRETFQRKATDRAHDICALARWGMVPAAIADELETSDSIVERVLRRAALWRRWYG